MRKETQRDCGGSGASWNQGPLGAIYRGGSGVQANMESEAGAQQALPIPSVLKPVAVTIPQPHKLVEDNGAEERPRVPVALQEAPGKQLQPGQVLAVQGSCGLQHLGHHRR